MKMTIRARITLGFAIVIAIAMIMGLFAYTRISLLGQHINSFSHDVVPGIFYGEELRFIASDNYGLLVQHILSESAQEMEAIEAKIKNNFAKAEDYNKKYEAAISSEKERALFNSYIQTRKEVAEGRAEVFALSRAMKTKEATELLHTKVDAALKKLNEECSAMVELNKGNGDRITDAALSASNAAKTGIWIGLGLALSLGGVIAVLIISSIGTALKRIAESLGLGSNQVTNASSQVSASSQSIAQGASEQAASLEETTSALEQMASMTKKNAETAQQTAALAKEASQASERGNEAMTKMSSAIEQIEKSASETAKIIKVIDEIAFQTNLLALNAAVEAARAGEAGKGFAVVAEEVRNLAMRSAEAAKNTSSMIEGSVANARGGVEIASEVAKVLGDITVSSTKVNTLITEMAEASREQAQGIDQISIAVSQMDQVTQANAASAEETASAAEELNGQAGQLADNVNGLLEIVNGSHAAQSGVAHEPSLHRPATRPGKAPPSLHHQTPLKSKVAKAEATIPFGSDDSGGKGFEDF